MRNNIAFRLSAQNSLKVNEIINKQQKSLVNTFKAGSDLRSQLNKVKPGNKPIKVNSNTNFKQEIKLEDEVLAQQIAALDHFKAPVTREKTKNMIQNIKLRRRQKHIETFNSFKQDVEQYKQNLFAAYDSLYNDTQQVLVIKTTQIEDYLKSCDNSEFILSRQKDLLTEITERVLSFKSECENKINFAKQQLKRIQNDRQQMAGQICHDLCMALIQIAFVLEPEALQIQKKQRNQIKSMQQERYHQFSLKIQKISQQQSKIYDNIQKLSQQIIKRWKEQKQQFQIQKYVKQADDDQLRRPHFLRVIFNKLMDIQMENHSRKVKLLSNLIQQNPDSLSKVNMGKVNAALKKINQIFESNLDDILQQFKVANNENKENNKLKLEKCKERLLFIQNHSPLQIENILTDKCQHLCNRNIKQQQDLIKQATASSENQDQRQTKVIQKMISFISKIAEENDNFIKEFGILNQKYEIQKARILDDDEELVEKAKQQLEQLKKQLKQSLHHIKLQQVQQKCFQKVDEIEKAYRLCHEKNKALKETRTPTLEDFFKNYEAKLAQILQLYAPTRRAELEQKKKKQQQQLAMRRIEAEDKKKAEEQLKLVEQAKAKGGKPPPAPKPKDPKKAAAQAEERKKAIMAELGSKKIQELKTDTGSIWLVFKDVKQICEDFFHLAIKELNQAKQKKQQQPIQQNAEQGAKKQIDAAQNELVDCRKAPVVNTKAFLKLNHLIPLVDSLRAKIFSAISEKKLRIINQSQKIDDQMMEDSLVNLDNRLKIHYSLKGTIQNQIFVKRSSQITNHKKKYEKYARTIKQKIDLQTQKFNFLLQKGLQSLKMHITEQKSMKEHIQKCKNLSQLQGMYSRTKDNFNTFGLTTKQICNQLERLSTVQIDSLLTKNEQFIKESKLMKEGGDYSDQQIAWYQQMMTQISTQMKEQQQKRQQKLQQLKQHSEKRKTQLLQAFQKEYNVAIEDVAARDGTGKKYGKPKRIAQQRMRLQMNKCEQSQININKMIEQIAREYEKQGKIQFKHQTAPQFILWRKQLMTIQFCIMRYSKHIQGLKQDLKIVSMARVTYNLKAPDAKLPLQQQEEDKKRKQEQLKSLGALSMQKDDRVFIKYVDDIEKVIGDESRTIYVGDKAKFLTGNDKIPDFLRAYIIGMKKSAQAFRVNCVRDLRQSCLKFSDLSANISEMVFSSMQSYYQNNQSNCKKKTLIKLNQFSQKHKNLRANNMKKLRPNLANPKCQDELKELDLYQKQRNQENKKYIIELSKQFKDNMFANAQQFLSCLLNNYEFLLLLTDSFYLYEDFLKLPGDEIQEKIHLDVQKLMIMKQKGIKIDSTSERNSKKKWEGLDFTIFDNQNRKYVYKKVDDVAKDPKDKDKKAGKKDTKDPKKQQQNLQDGNSTKSKNIQTFKTWRQKSVYQNRQRIRASFKAQYDKDLAEVNEKIQIQAKENAVHQTKWRQIASSLYLK